MTTLTLYELAEEAAALDDLTAMEDGEWTPEADTLHTELMDKLLSKADGTLFTIALHKNPPSLLVNVLPDSLPPEYVRVIPEQREPDKKALMEAVKAGADIPGVELAPTTYHIRVK